MTLVNGVDTDAVKAADRGLAYGDGVYRTVRVRDGAPDAWSRHVAKLASDCRALGLSFPAEPLLREDVLRICREQPQCVLKIIVTRGITERGYRYDRTAQPTRIVLSAPLPDYPVSYTEAGVHVRLCRLKLSHQPALAGVKHLNRLENVLARAEWSDANIVEGLLCDGDGNVIGGTMTNVFVVKNGVLATPRLDRCGVAGVTRDHVIEAAARHDIFCDVTVLPWQDVLNAEEVFLVNSLAGVWPVCSIQGEPRTPGPLVRAARTWLDS